MGCRDWFVDSVINAQGSLDAGFEGIHYFQSICLHKEAFEAIDQTNVESLTENFKVIDDVVSSKLMELLKLPLPALGEEILRLQAFKVVKQRLVSTTSFEFQMIVKYLQDMSTMLQSWA